MSKIIARGTFASSKSLKYRYLGVVGSGRVCRAQDFPGARVDGFDTWSEDQVDPRMTRKTVVEVPAGLLVLSSEYDRYKRHEGYIAGVTVDGPGNQIDYERARHISVRREEPKGRDKGPTRTFHLVEVDGVRSEYEEVVS